MRKCADFIEASKPLEQYKYFEFAMVVALATARDRRAP